MGHLGWVLFSHVRLAGCWLTQDSLSFGNGGNRALLLMSLTLQKASLGICSCQWRRHRLLGALTRKWQPVTPPAFCWPNQVIRQANLDLRIGTSSPAVWWEELQSHVAMVVMCVCVCDSTVPTEIRNSPGEVCHYGVIGCLTFSGFSWTFACIRHYWNNIIHDKILLGQGELTTLTFTCLLILVSLKRFLGIFKNPVCWLG